MSEKLAWAAGFFDGEGSTDLMAGKRKRDYPTLRVSLIQHGDPPIVLRRFHDAILLRGKVRGPYLVWVSGGYSYVPYKTPRYTWSAIGDEAFEVLETLWPYLSVVKRDQALRVFDAVNQSFKRRRPYGAQRRHYSIGG